ncbi:MAG: ABC transporter substrate-binding protein [Desulfobacteraceae bacterium]|nr:ABC transporter substrate-binding protein [Desulfobacteraceae bacterium]
MERKKESWFPKIGLSFIMLAGFFILLSGILTSCGKASNVQILKIGLPEEPKSLNVWLGTDANSRKILSQIYQPLYTRDPKTLKIIPWLAKEDPVFDEAAMTYTVSLREAKWSDGSDFTSDDVAFTKQIFFDFKIPRYYSKWKIIKKIETPDKHTVVFYLKKPSAIFLSRVLTAPMVSRKEWESVVKQAKQAEKPLRALQDHLVEKPLGTGPFVLFENKKGSYLHMKRNPHFFGSKKTIAGLTLGPYVENLLFKIYGTSDVAILALKKGDIDMYWWNIQPGYIKELKEQKNIRVFLNKKSALYYMGFNVRKPPFDDVNLRRAIAALIDKDFILTRILENYGTAMHSIIPSGNHFWHNPDVVKYGYGLSNDDRIKKAYEILKKAGYTWDVPPVDKTGNLVKAEGIKLPDGTPMEKFMILTPPSDYDPKRAFAGIMIQEWLKDMGMQVFARPMAFNSLIDTVKGKRDFNAFILGYGKLNLDPDYLNAFFNSKNDKPRGWNMSGYKNIEYDKIANEQRSVVDVDKRKAMIWKMQEMIMQDVPYIPLYNPHIIEAVCTDRFEGWLEKVDGIGNIWSICLVKPKS